jgi:ankyrin repeat protein
MTPSEALVDAVRNNRVDDAVHILLFAAPDPDTRDLYGCPVLFLAARAGNVDMVETLLHFGADPTLATEKEKATPLHVACLHGHAPVAVLLADAKADINARDKDGDTPLHLAAHEELLTLCQFLIQRGADVFAKNGDNQTPRQMASEYLTPNYIALHSIFSEVVELLEQEERKHLGKADPALEKKANAAFRKNTAALDRITPPQFFPAGPKP